MEKITILITDDHKLVRETWSLILNADPRFKVVAEADSGEAAIELARSLRPNIAIMDINLTGMNGIVAGQRIQEVSPQTRLLGVSMHTQPAFVRQMMQKGAMGYVTKNSSCKEMCKAIVEVHNGRKYICEEIKNILSDCMVSGTEGLDGFNSLSKREIEIIELIKKGLSSKEIADPLCISAKTVEVHRYNILKKLKLKNTAAMVNHFNNSQPLF
ncbi:MAG: response regulator transcription factor [Chitinophagaceae bacterium]|nr:response regulator transcription factor [Chitinophagaceae bacterium]